MHNTGLEAEKKRLLGALIGFARASENNEDLLTGAMLDCVWDSMAALRGERPAEPCIESLAEAKQVLVPDCMQCSAPCGRTDDYAVDRMEQLEEKERAAKYNLLQRLTHCPQGALETGLLLRALYALGMEDIGETYVQRLQNEVENSLRMKA